MIIMQEYYITNLRREATIMNGKLSPLMEVCNMMELWQLRKKNLITVLNIAPNDTAKVINLSIFKTKKQTKTKTQLPMDKNDLCCQSNLTLLIL